MKYSDYLTICKEFANDSRTWSALEESRFYTTDISLWIETPDNAHGGLDVSWAFHRTESEIEQMAP